MVEFDKYPPLENTKNNKRRSVISWDRVARNVATIQISFDARLLERDRHAELRNRSERGTHAARDVHAYERVNKRNGNVPVTGTYVYVLGSLKKGTEMQLTSLMDLESRSCWSDEHRHIELKLQLDRWRQDPNIAQVVRSVVHISSDISRLNSIASPKLAPHLITKTPPLATKIARGQSRPTIPFINKTKLYDETFIPNNFVGAGIRPEAAAGRLRSYKILSEASKEKTFLPPEDEGR
ncbi:hypothetical protein Trydic_g12338 [Trypoxylus dichotomus]